MLTPGLILQITSWTDQTLQKEKDKKVTGVKKDKFGGKVMKKFAGLRAKFNSYLIDANNEGKKEKVQNSVL